MRPLFRTGAVLVLFAAAAVSAATVTPQKADAFEQKLARIVSRAQVPSSGQRTDVPNDELNAYLQLRYAAQLPTGVADPAVDLLGGGRISGRAMVDLDGIRKKSSGGWLDPTAYLTGRLPVVAVGVLKTTSGRGVFTLERAEISGVPIPKTLLQELVTYYTATPEAPAGINLDRPFELPAGIQRIDVLTGRATIVQ
jgi:hypothetical protein